MAKKTVRSKQDFAKLKGVVEQLPDVLAGIKRDNLGIRKLFWAVFARELYKRISKGFLDKSIGGTDELGNSWKPLKPSTIERKLSRPIRYKSLRKSKTFREAINKVAKSKAPILVDTGRLYTSLMPGKVSGGIYEKKNEDQIFEIKKGEVTLGSKVPYQNEQGKVRPLWPEKMDKWIDESLDKALEALTLRLKQLNKT